MCKRDVLTTIVEMAMTNERRGEKEENNNPRLKPLNSQI